MGQPPAGNDDCLEARIEAISSADGFPDDVPEARAGLCLQPDALEERSIPGPALSSITEELAAALCSTIDDALIGNDAQREGKPETPAAEVDGNDQAGGAESAAATADKAEAEKTERARKQKEQQLQQEKKNQNLQFFYLQQVIKKLM